MKKLLPLIATLFLLSTLSACHHWRHGHGNGGVHCPPGQAKKGTCGKCPPGQAKKGNCI